MKYAYAVLILAFLGCDSPSTPEIIYRSIDCEDSGFVNVQEWRKEILHVDSISINGKVPLINSLSVFTDVFGSIEFKYPVQSEEVAIYNVEASEMVRNIFKGAIVDGSNEKSIVNTIDFRNTSISLVHPEITLKNGTPVSEVCKVFPRSCRLIPSNGNLWSGFIELKLHQSGLDFRRIFLIFQGEKLVKVRIINVS